MEYKKIKHNLEKTRRYLAHPESLLKNLDASKIIYSLADFKEKKLLSIAKEIGINDKNVSVKLKLLIEGNYIVKNEKKFTYRLNKEAIKELFFYWIEMRINQIRTNEEPIKKSTLLQYYSEQFYNKLKDNKFFEDLFFISMNSFNNFDIPLSGFFSLFTSETMYRYILRPSEFFIIGFSYAHLESDPKFIKRFFNLFIENIPSEYFNKHLKEKDSLKKLLALSIGPSVDKLIDIVSLTNALFEKVIMQGFKEKEQFDKLILNLWKKKYSEKEIEDFKAVLEILKADSRDMLLKGIYLFSANVINENMTKPRETITPMILKYFEEVLKNNPNRFNDIYEKFFELLLKSNDEEEKSIEKRK